MLLKRIRTENMRDVFEERIGLTFEGQCFAFDCIDFDTTEWIRFSTSFFRTLEGKIGVFKRMKRRDSYREIQTTIDEDHQKSFGEFFLFDHLIICSFNLKRTIDEQKRECNHLTRSKVDFCVVNVKY